MPALKRPAAAVAAKGRGVTPPAKKAAKAPPKAPKAAAPAEPKPPKPAKRSKPMVQVLGGLNASDLPPSAVAMLDGMLDGSLGVYKEKRDALQGRAVDLVGGVLAAVEGDYTKRVEEAEALIAQETQAREELEGQKTAKLEELDAKKDVVQGKKRALAEVTQSFLRARKAVAEAEEHASAEEVQAGKNLAQKESLAALLEDFNNPSAEEGQAESLLDRLKGLGIDESMMMALPAVLAKEASARGAFDTMVLTSVREELGTRIKATDEAIQNAEPTRAANAEALRKAQAAFEKEKEQQMGGADAYWKVNGEEEQLDDQLQAIRKASSERSKALRTHNSAKAKATRLLGNFTSGPKSAFEGLRDATEPVAEAPAEEAAEEAQPSAEGAEATEGAAPEAEAGGEAAAEQ